MRSATLSVAMVFALVLTVTACKDDEGESGNSSTPAACTYDGVTYTSGSWFDAGDGCNTCQCDNGTVGCTKVACGPCAGGTAETCVQEGQVACEQWACVDCTTDRECDDSWCRSTEEGGMECVDYAGPDERCGGYVLPWTRGRCEDGLTCIHPEPTGDIPGTCGTCDYDGTAYQIGDTWEASDGCNTCSCGEGGLIACTRIYCPMCHYLGQDYSPGDSFDSYDSCNSCFCNDDGVVGCTKIGCPADSCRDGTRPVNCLRDPCDGARCDVEGAWCVADYCGGCHARWFDGQGNSVCEE